MKIFNLVDTAFAHCEYSAPGLKSEKMKWDRISEIGTTFYTHEKILNGPCTINSGINYAWLLESQAIIPSIYNDMITHPNIVGQYDKIFTHSSTLLKLYSHARWIPGGSIWIGGEYGGGEIKIYPKSRLCSMVSSDKQMCHLHRLRISIAMFLSSWRSDIDQFGTLFGKWVPAIDALADYKFSIIMENYQDDLYFTEKLLNCFATGTVPIYLGAKNIDKLFNPAGILSFTDAHSLLDVITEDMNDRFYKSRQEAIKENFELCKQYRLLEDYILEKYL